MTAKKKVVIKRSRQKQSPNLDLKNEPHKDTARILAGVRKDVEEPPRWGRASSSEWDHLISALDKKNALPMEHKIAGAVAARAKRLGYVIRLKKIDADFTELWFGGFLGLPKPKQVKAKTK